MIRDPKQWEQDLSGQNKRIQQRFKWHLQRS